MNKTVGVLIAGAAAGLILSGAVSARADEKAGGDVYCSGINSCKGTSACKTASSSCKGQNSCKGQGWRETTDAASCTSKGGKVVE